LPDLLSKVRSVGVPPKVTAAWLKSIGFTSSNDPTMIGVLKQIGFVDQAGVPTPAWKAYRGADHKAVLGRAIQSGYESLFHMYPDANERTPTELGHVFSTQTNAGTQTVNKMVSTFKSLATVAEFEAGADSPLVSSEGSPASAPVVHSTLPPAVVTQVPQPTNSALAVNVNIQLTLPDTADAKVYEAFFKAMKENLFPDDLT
jgi:hypothetical protein